MDNLIEILTIIAAVLVLIIGILFMVFWYIKIKEKNNKKDENQNKEEVDVKTTKKEKTSQYTKLSIFDFMEFDKIEDNMIVQNGGTRYLMVVECEGINYDLMSELEKTSVEAGFVQFLNTLRHPIQIYTQTRTINIGSSIENYSKRIQVIKTELDRKQLEFNKMLQSVSYSSKEANKLKQELARLQNLYDYGKDVTSNIERMSLNKNVLKKHYYIIVPYYTSELGNAPLDEEEKKQMVFSELYTRCQSIIRTLFACSMKCKVMDSYEVAELLYVAYNRDESETYGIEKALKAGYTELYTTAPDVLDKRMEALNNAIEEKALEMAKDVVNEVKTEKQLVIEKKEKTFNQLVKEMAQKILEENEPYLGKETTNKAIDKVNGKKTKEEGNANDKEEKKRTRRTTKTNASA